MQKLALILAALQPALLVLGVEAPAQPQVFHRWATPRLYGRKVLWGRQNTVDYFPGYPPEFGACGSGLTCEDACGPGYEQCKAGTSLSLFCYNPSAGETCCGNGSGRKSPTARNNGDSVEK